VALRDLVPAPGAAGSGVDLPPGMRLDFAWVANPGAPLFAAPGGRVARALSARARIGLRAPCAAGASLCAVEGGWMRAVDLRVPRAAPPPPGVAADELWLDVDRASNTLLALEGGRPVFACLVSTGTGAPGTPFATPAGVFRIQTKARSATMDNLEHSGVPAVYSYEDVPDVQYFTARVALHAALWHDRFGHAASHGCVNAAPADAARLFALTRPRPGALEDRAEATPDSPGTLLRVR
jgi:hypothetical protein